MRLGIIARCDNTGLGNQTYNLVKMLNPDKVMLINSFSFNRNKQYPERYNGYNCIHVRGFPDREQISQFLKEIDVVITCETFYNNSFVDLAKQKNVKTVLQYNYEFLDYLQKPNLTLPDVLISPSMWNIDHVSELFGDKAQVIYLPPPIETENFEKSRTNNLIKDHNKILHVAGKSAAKDRNGTQSIVEMLKYSKSDYEIVITTQSPLEIKCDDPRLTIDASSPLHSQDLYNGFDAVVLPRRYAGLCLPMNEALVSALPVFMTNISPNNQILPESWLVKSQKIDTLMTRIMLDVYEANPKELAKTIDLYMDSKDKNKIKNQALALGMDKFDMPKLKQQYLDILEK